MRSIVLSGILILMITSIACSEKGSQEPAINQKNMDLSVSPAEDFYQYANGGWMKNNPLKPEFSRYGTFDQLAEANQERLKLLTEKLSTELSSNDPIARKTGLFFKTGMDSALAEKLGAEPLSPLFAQIDAINSAGNLQDAIIHLHSLGVFPLFNLFAEADSKNSKMVLAWLFQGGIGMPDRDYYLDENERALALRTAYKDYIEKAFQLTGAAEATARESAEVVLKLETALAKSSMTRLEMRDPNAIYHKTSQKELAICCPTINWDAYFSGLGLKNPGDLNLAQPEFFREIDKLLKTVSIDQWKPYLRWHVLNEMAPYLNQSLVEAHFNFYGRELSGKQEMEPRWKRVINSCDDALGMALGQIYVKEYFPPAAKDRMLELVNNLKIALETRIGKLEWMSEITKTKAVEKLHAMKLKIGYPDKWRDYSKLEVTGKSFAEDILSASRFNTAYMLSKINQPVDADEWDMTPQTVNAYYNPSKNEIVFPAGILQPPFFYIEADDAVNYGAIGMVIGHEMTHGFDDQGRLYDQEGNLTDWWTMEDSKKFKEKASQIVEQYKSYRVLDSVFANGELTLGENIADFGGMHISLSAFNMTKQAQEDVKTDGYTPLQRFYLAYAHVWAQNIREKEILRRTKEDEHSLGILRVIVPLKNMDQFYTAFNVQEGDAMYVKPENRTTIW